ncbi:MAG TPA: tyrosine-type recombinase/integrase [Streptosporangiaceae bacterium]|nr:tyrosine-type recombinase/integrase [Streptosporangiaceae bacterium]
MKVAGVKIQKIVLADGKTIRWRAQGVSAGKDPATGKRMQRTVTGKTQKEVRDEVARITGKVADRTYVRPSKATVADVINAYLKTASFEAEANTVLSNRVSLLPALDRLGDRQARSVTRADIEELRDYLLSSGRRRGGKPGTGLSPRSVRLTLGRLSAAFDQACEDGKLSVNPCRYVRKPASVQRQATTWTEAELGKFLAVAQADRLYAAWLLSVLGLRRGEVLGLKWSDIDLNAGVLRIEHSRVLVSGTGVVEKTPKSERSYRTLPLFEPVITALEALRVRQLDEMTAAGPAYANAGYVVADELGRPVPPKWYSTEFRRLYSRAGLPAIRLHDTRGTVNSLLERSGMPDSLRAAWLGHRVEVNRTAYLAAPRDLSAVSSAIGALLGPGVTKA